MIKILNAINNTTSNIDPEIAPIEMRPFARYAAMFGSAKKDNGEYFADEMPVFSSGDVVVTMGDCRAFLLAHCVVQ